MLRMPDGTTSVLTQGQQRVEIVEFTQTEPYYRVRARPIFEPTERPPATEALMRAVLALFEKVVQLNRNLPENAYVFAMNVDEPGWLADLVASTIELRSARSARKSSKSSTRRRACSGFRSCWPRSWTCWSWKTTSIPRSSARWTSPSASFTCASK